MRTFNAIMMILAVSMINASAWAAEGASDLPSIVLHESTEFKILNRALIGGKETCKTADRSFVVVVADGAKNLLEYTAPANGTGCPTGAILITDAATVSKLREKSSNYTFHETAMEIVNSKQTSIEISSGGSLLMVGADSRNTGIDWGELQFCNAQPGDTLDVRVVSEYNGSPAIIYQYQKTGGGAGEGACLDKSFVIVNLLQLPKLLASGPVERVTEKRSTNASAAAAPIIEPSEQPEVESSDLQPPPKAAPKARGKKRTNKK